MGDYEVPPEINSGRMYAGPGSGSLQASAAAWQALAAQLGSAGAAFHAVIEALVAGPWLGPSSMSMAMAAAPYVVWMLATAAQCEQAAAAATEAAGAFEAARAGVVPPPVIEANRNMLMTLIATNFMGFNTPAIAATEAAYDEMWSQDTAVMYGWAADGSGVAGMLAGSQFVPPLPNSDPVGLAAQAAALGQNGATGAGRQPVNFASQAGGLTSLPAGIEPQTMLTMGPQLVSMVPQALQGLSSPLSGGLGSPASGLGQFQSLLTPFMSVLSNPGLLGAGSGGAAGAAPAMAGLGPAAGAGAQVEAMAGRAASLGGLSVPATWTAGAVAEPAAAAGAAAPLTGSGAAAGAGAAAAPGAAGGAGMYGGAPLAAGASGRGGAGGPRYGTPVKLFGHR